MQIFLFGPIYDDLKTAGIWFFSCFDFADELTLKKIAKEKKG
jgi:hypothetical protein